MTGSATVIRGNALALPLPNNSVDACITSPPYFGLRSYQDAGEHYANQIGSEPTPAEFLDALIAATREMVRVLKPTGSIFINLGDKYVADNTGTTALVAKALGRHGITVDLSADYCRLAEWRVNDHQQLAVARGEKKPPPIIPAEETLFAGWGDA